MKSLTRQRCDVNNEQIECLLDFRIFSLVVSAPRFDCRCIARQKQTTPTRGRKPEAQQGETIVNNKMDQSQQTKPTTGIPVIVAGEACYHRRCNNRTMGSDHNRMKKKAAAAVAGKKQAIEINLVKRERKKEKEKERKCILVGTQERRVHSQQALATDCRGEPLAARRN